MYWNNSLSDGSNGRNQINRNMRCIEIEIFGEALEKYNGLIETWDVLKCFCTVRTSLPMMINRNMRCIEIAYI